MVLACWCFLIIPLKLACIILIWPLTIPSLATKFSQFKIILTTAQFGPQKAMHAFWCYGSIFICWRLYWSFLGWWWPVLEFYPATVPAIISVGKHIFNYENGDCETLSMADENFRPSPIIMANSGVFPKLKSVVPEILNEMLKSLRNKPFCCTRLTVSGSMSYTMLTILKRTNLMKKWNVYRSPTFQKCRILYHRTLPITSKLMKTALSYWKHELLGT